MHGIVPNLSRSSLWAAVQDAMTARRQGEPPGPCTKATRNGGARHSSRAANLNLAKAMAHTRVGTADSLHTAALDVTSPSAADQRAPATALSGR